MHSSIADWVFGDAPVDLVADDDVFANTGTRLELENSRSFLGCRR